MEYTEAVAIISRCVASLATKKREIHSPDYDLKFDELGKEFFLCELHAEVKLTMLPATLECIALNISLHTVLLTCTIYKALMRHLFLAKEKALIFIRIFKPG